MTGCVQSLFRVLAATGFVFKDILEMLLTMGQGVSGAGISDANLRDQTGCLV